MDVKAFRHPDGLEAAKACQTPGLCLFCEEPLAKRVRYLCGSFECQAAYNRAYMRDRLACQGKRPLAEELAELRAAVMLADGSGQRSARELAEEFGITARTVVRWRAARRAEGRAA